MLPAFFCLIFCVSCRPAGDHRPGFVRQPSPEAAPIGSAVSSLFAAAAAPVAQAMRA